MSAKNMTMTMTLFEQLVADYKSNTRTWRTATEYQYDHWLNAFSPTAQNENGFLAGEAWSHTYSGQPIYMAFRSGPDAGTYQAILATEAEFSLSTADTAIAEPANQGTPMDQFQAQTIDLLYPVLLGDCGEYEVHVSAKRLRLQSRLHSIRDEVSGLVYPIPGRPHLVAVDLSHGSWELEFDLTNQLRRNVEFKKAAEQKLLRIWQYELHGQSLSVWWDARHHRVISPQTKFQTGNIDQPRLPEFADEDEGVVLYS